MKVNELLEELPLLVYLLTSIRVNADVLFYPAPVAFSVFYCVFNALCLAVGELRAEAPAHKLGLLDCWLSHEVGHQRAQLIICSLDLYKFTFQIFYLVDVYPGDKEGGFLSVVREGDEVWLRVALRPPPRSSLGFRVDQAV